MKTILLYENYFPIPNDDNENRLRYLLERVTHRFVSSRYDELPLHITELIESRFSIVYTAISKDLLYKCTSIDILESYKSNGTSTKELSFCFSTETEVHEITAHTRWIEIDIETKEISKSYFLNPNDMESYIVKPLELSDINSYLTEGWK